MGAALIKYIDAIRTSIKKEKNQAESVSQIDNTSKKGILFAQGVQLML